MSEKKREQAMRLYEAMGGVDPELLARSEKEVTAKKKVIPFYRYAKVMAACLALFLVGGTCFLTLRNGGQKDAMTESNDAAKSINKSKGENAAPQSVQSDASFENNAEQACVSDNAMQADEAEDLRADARDVFEGADGAGASATINHSEAAAIDGDRTKTNEQPAVEAELATDGTLLFKGNSLKIVPNEMVQYFADKNLEVVMENGEVVAITNRDLGLAVYSYLNQLEKEAVPERTFEQSVTVKLIDPSGDVAKSFCISDVFVKLDDLPDTFKILDEEYDYELLKEALQEMAQEGQ